MVSYRLIAFAGLAAALPLNINLGAYSPALVVGDGEISFGGRQDVSSLMNALEGAAVNAAAGAKEGGAAREGAGAAAGAAAAGNTAAGGAAGGATTNAASTTPALDSINTGAVTTTPDATLAQQAQQVSSLQGMGKEIAPREGEKVAKRDAAGFDRALKFAEVALTKGPNVQLGTGEGGSGVGIIVANNPTAAPAGGAARVGKRDDESPRRRSKVTTMYVRRGVPASLQGQAEVETRDVQTAPVASPVSRRDAIDAVNLNVNGDEGVTMTFVETVEDDEDHEDDEE